MLPALSRIDHLEYSLAERKVADWLKKQSQQPAWLARIAQVGIQEVAQAVGVSQPTVLRFTRTAGFTGWPDFRNWLAVSAATAANLDLGQGEQKPAYSVLDVFNQAIAALVQVRNDVSADAIAKAASWLARAERIECYGQGNSGIIASDAAHKFFRLGLHASAFSDPHMHLSSAAMLGANDVVLALSNSGFTRELIDSMTWARSSRAKVIAITVPETPVAKVADLVLPIDPSAERDLTLPMTARIAQLVLIDALAVETARLLGQPIKQRMRRYQRAMLDKKAAEKAK